MAPETDEKGIGNSGSQAFKDGICKKRVTFTGTSAKSFTGSRSFQNPRFFDLRNDNLKFFAFI